MRARLQAGEDFATLANTESDDTASAAKGGDLERWLKRTDVVAPFAEALAKLETGQVSDVVETQFGLHLIKSSTISQRAYKASMRFDSPRTAAAPRLRQGPTGATGAGLLTARECDVRRARLAVFAQQPLIMLDFLGIGAQKAGTTWLYEQFNHHPQLAFPLGQGSAFLEPTPRHGGG